MSVNKMQEAFDYANENDCVLEVHELMEAFAQGYEKPADVLDYVLLVMSGVVSKEDFDADLEMIRSVDNFGDID